MPHADRPTPRPRQHGCCVGAVVVLQLRSCSCWPWLRKARRARDTVAVEPVNATTSDAVASCSLSAPSAPLLRGRPWPVRLRSRASYVAPWGAVVAAAPPPTAASSVRLNARHRGHQRPCQRPTPRPLFTACQSCLPRPRHCHWCRLAAAPGPPWRRPGRSPPTAAASRSLRQAWRCEQAAALTCAQSRRSRAGAVPADPAARAQAQAGARAIPPCCR